MLAFIEFVKMHAKMDFYIVLPARLIKHGSEQIAAPLCFVANQSLQSGLFPNSEKYARVIPIHKSGEKSNFDNY